MAKKYISSVEINHLIRKNRIPVFEDNWFLSRCIDGRYEIKTNGQSDRQEKKTKFLEPLAKPGADLGDLMMVFSANFQYHLGLKREEIFQAFLKTIDGWQNFRFHTDNHFLNPKIKSLNPSGISNSQAPINNFFGCGHFREVVKDPEAYGLINQDIEAIYQFIKQGLANKTQLEILRGDHKENGVLIVKSDNFSVAPQAVIGEELFMIFVYHKSLDDKRRKKLVKNIILTVGSNNSFDEDYLYQSFSQVADDHFLETINRLAPDLPVYEVIFNNENEFEIKKW